MSNPVFGRIYAVTATETRKSQSGSDGRRSEVSFFPVRKFAFPQHKHMLTIGEIGDS